MGNPNPNTSANAPSGGNESPQYVHQSQPSYTPPAPAQYHNPPPPTYPPPAAAEDEDTMRTSPVDTTDRRPAMGFPAVNPEAYPPQPVAYPPPSHQNNNPAAPLPEKHRPVGYPPPSPGNVQFAQYPPATPTQAAASPYRYVGKPWASNLYDFDMNSTNAVMTAFFPCVTFGQIAEILDEGQTTCTTGSIMYLLLMPVLACSILGNIYRKKLRMKYNLVEAPAEDWILHLFCPCCSLCQEYRELEAKRIDPSLGWLGNIALQQDMIKSAPEVQTMNR